MLKLIIFYLIVISIIIIINSNSVNYYSYTRAIYNGYYLQDYIIYCRDSILIDIVPIGNSIYVGTEWKDPRPSISNLCDRNKFTLK